MQSYAYANSDYFYQDGVFYSVSASGNYTTIVPPAGALVSSLPDDYETIVLNGIEYYMVDNTVYRTTLFDGQPYLAGSDVRLAVQPVQHLPVSFR